MCNLKKKVKQFHCEIYNDEIYIYDQFIYIYIYIRLIRYL